MGISHPISLASGVVPEFGPEATAAAALAAGFDATGIWVEPEQWTAATTRKVRECLRGQIPVLDVEVVWIRPGPDNPDHFRVIDIGAELGAANVLIVSSDPDFAATTEKFHRLCEHAGACGLHAALEFGVFTEIKTLGEALDILARAARENAALLIDPLHLSRSGGAPADVEKVPKRLFSYAQFCDAPAAMPDRNDAKAIIEEAVDLRLMPGEGALPLVSLLAALPEHLPLSIELRSRALREIYPDANGRARALAAATRNFLNRVQGEAK